MKALKERKSYRKFEGKEIPLQTLSDLLWAAYGNNRENSTRATHTFLAYKTVPSYCASYMFQYSFFVFTLKAIYRYDSDKNKLIFIKEGNFMDKTGFQDFVKDGSVNVVMFSDYKSMKENRAEHMRSYFNDETCLKTSCFDSGYISQNIYIYCQLHGLKTIARAAAGDEKTLKQLLGLGADHHLSPSYFGSNCWILSIVIINFKNKSLNLNFSIKKFC